MRAFLILMFGVLGLAGCSMPPITAASVSPKIPTVTPDRQTANMFVAVVQDVEPFVEDICVRTDARRNCDFRIVIDDTPGAQANAFQTVDRSGRPVIAFTLALLDDIQNEDEFAFVLAHEASHHIAGHLERTQRNAAVGAMIFGELAGVAGTGLPSNVQAAREIGAAVASRAYSKDYELEADTMAARIVTAAGYDALRGAAFFARIPDPGDRFLGSHPANADRVAAVRRAVGAI